MPISSGVLWMVYADTAFLRKLERHNLCPLATIPRHRCGQRVYNCGQKPCIAPPRCPKLPSTPDACYRELRRILIPRTSLNKAGQASSEALSDYTRGCRRHLGHGVLLTPSMRSSHSPGPVPLSLPGSHPLLRSIPFLVIP